MAKSLKQIVGEHGVEPSRLDGNARDVARMLGRRNEIVAAVASDQQRSLRAGTIAKRILDCYSRDCFLVVSERRFCTSETSRISKRLTSGFAEKLATLGEVGIRC